MLALPAFEGEKDGWNDREGVKLGIDDGLDDREGAILGWDDGSAELEGLRLGSDDGSADSEGVKLGWEDGWAELEGFKLGCHDGRVVSVGDELGEVDGSAVEGTGVTSLGLAVGAALLPLEPAATASMAKPSVIWASASSRPERAAERRLALLPLISAVMGVALNKRESAAAVVVIFMLKSL